MSYILDALKKSEKERQRGTLPDMLTVQDIVADKPKKRLAWWAYLIAVALIMNAGILAWWLGFSETEKAKVVQQAVVAEKAPLLSVNDTAQTEPETGKSSSDYSQTIIPEAGSASQNIVPATVSSGPALVVPDNSLSQPKKQVVQDIPVKTVPDKLAPDSDIVKQLVRASAPAPVHAPAKPEQTERTAHLSHGPAEDHAGMPEVNKIYKFKELPSSIQQNLPSFSISALMYSNNPASRIVRINDQMIYEGQELTEGVKLEEITRDGVILRHQKYRFYVGVK